MGDRITIVLVDDHAVVRSALRLLLDAEQDLEVVAEAGDVDGALRSVGAHRPDVLILDRNMPDGPTTPAVPALRETSPETAIVVLTMEGEAAYAREALRAGVLGYVLKEAAEDELVTAVRLAAAGRTYLQPDLGARLAAEPGEGEDGSPSASSRSCARWRWGSPTPRSARSSGSACARSSRTARTSSRSWG